MCGYIDLTHYSQGRQVWVGSDNQSYWLVQANWFQAFWSYGKVDHKDGALIPEGRVLIDAANSFVYDESGLKSVLIAAWLSVLSNLNTRAQTSFKAEADSILW